ncbi:MAG TPA: hypothetical protein VGD37_05365 [Kofleriaceae bacterium]
MVAQDGTKATASTQFAAHCVHSGATGACKSFSPDVTPGGGSGDPKPGGW